ncbi:MAG: hypothetical protein K9W44_15495 [Candidatus Lokiarchaeota archaeon]|nr:hypothetical protein [Candidatus Harpocratesius repetitus]
MLVQTAESPAIQSLVIGGIIILIFLGISIMLLHRNRNRLAISLSLYFIFTALGLTVNFIYRLLELLGVLSFENSQDVVIFSVLNLITLYLTTIAGIHLLNFNLILFFSTKIFNKKRQLIVVLLYALILIGIFIIGFIPFNIGGESILGITWAEHPSPNQSSIVPYYNIYLGGYFIIMSQIVFIFILYYSTKITKKMGKNKYSKKYLRNIIGILFFDLQLIGAFIANTFGSSVVARNIGLWFQLLFTIPGALFLAFGLRKEPEND